MEPEPELEFEAPPALPEEPSDPCELSLAGSGLGVLGSELPGLCSELAAGAAGAVGFEGSLGAELGEGDVSLAGELGLAPALGSALAGADPPVSAGATAEVGAPSAVPDVGAEASAASALGDAPTTIAAARAAAHAARRKSTFDPSNAPTVARGRSRLTDGSPLRPTRPR